MKIVIIGDGKVGHKLTTQLSEENYDVVLIDQNEGKLKEAENILKELIEKTNQEDGCIEYKSYLSNSSSDEIVIIEKWESHGVKSQSFYSIHHFWKIPRECAAAA